jgi:hypothetical protein
LKLLGTAFAHVPQNTSCRYSIRSEPTNDRKWREAVGRSADTP